MSDSDIFEEISNPLDSVEDILNSHDWVFNRTNSDELIVDVKGRCSCYRMMFIWQDEFSAMQFVCQYGFPVHEANACQLPVALMAMNSELWLGNFDIDHQTGFPVFRYNSLFRGMTQTSGAEHIEDLGEIAINECERFHSVFHLLSLSTPIDDASLRLALMSAAGES